MISKKCATINGTTHPLPLTETYIRTSFKDVFKGLGALPGGQYSIHMKEGATPVCHAPRAVPEKKKKTYQIELARLVKLGVVTKVIEFTPWVNSIVPAMKTNGDIRLCRDPKDLNAAMERNHYYSKTVQEVQAELGRTEAKMFTLLDAKCGF